MRCLTCHYDLSNLTEHRCPECGRDFNPTDPKTFETPESKFEAVESRVVKLIIVGFGVLFVVASAIQTYVDVDPLSVTLLAAGVVLAAMWIRRSR